MTDTPAGRARVAVISCPTYEERPVQAAVERGLDLLGGAAVFVRPGEKILLKPNLLAASAPEKAVTTHPAVFRAVALALRRAGAELHYGDSPGIGTARRTAAACGIAAAANELAIPLADFLTAVTISCPAGGLLKQLQLAKGALEADGIVSLPKMKTHALTVITGAIKNQFGCVPGFLKGEFHVKMPDIARFAQVLVDINLRLRPRLFVMDGITAMAGNGPRGGEPFAMNVLLLSADPVALDTVFCALIDLDPALVPTLAPAAAAGLGRMRMEEIELVGDPLPPLVRRDFTVRRHPEPGRTRLGPIPPALRHWFTPSPVIRADRCRRCGECVAICPVAPKAVHWGPAGHAVAPSHTYDRCIRCYCCQEICPAQAITLRSPWLGRLFHFLLD